MNQNLDIFSSVILKRRNVLENTKEEGWKTVICFVQFFWNFRICLVYTCWSHWTQKKKKGVSFGLFDI